jgi:hypothetical protein
VPDLTTIVAIISVVVAILAAVAALLSARYAYPAYRASKIETSRRHFTDTRKKLRDERHNLTTLALYREPRFVHSRLPGMLTKDSWVPAEPFLLDAVKLDLQRHYPSTSLTTEEILARAKRQLPRGPSGKRLDTYTEAMSAFAKPSLFSNKLCYRILDARLDKELTASITVSLNHYFNSVDETEAVAHEFAEYISAKKGSVWEPFPVRAAFGDPLCLRSRNAIFSVSALTIRADEASSTFVLHAREGDSVAIAGNLVHIAPSGVFQPTADDEMTIIRDLSLWLTLCREYAEEYLGTEEAEGRAGIALSYDDDEPYCSINTAYSLGAIQIYVLGLGLDPLTLCPELVTVAVVDSEVFDELFREMVMQNSEGLLRGAQIRGGRIVGYPFNERTIQGLLASERLSPAGRAALSRAWELKDWLLR